MNKLFKLLLVLISASISGVLIALSVLFYNEGEAGDHYDIYPPLGGIGIIVGIITIVLIIRFMFSSSNSSSTHETEYADSLVDLDSKYSTKLEETKTYQLSIGYTDGKENKCIDAMKKYGWTLVRKNEFNLTLYFERETESLEIEKMLLPIAIRMNNDDDRFLEERKNHIYTSMELAKRLYNQRPSEIDTARYAGSLLASAISTEDFPFKDIYEAALEEVRTRVEIKPQKTYDYDSSYSYSDSYSSYDDNDSYEDSSTEDFKEENPTEIEDYHRIFDSSWSILGFYRDGLVFDSSYNVIGEYRNGYVEHHGSFYGEYNSSGYMFRYSQKIGRCQDGTIYDEYDHMIGKYDGSTDGACAAAMLIIF